MLDRYFQGSFLSAAEENEVIRQLRVKFDDRLFVRLLPSFNGDRRRLMRRFPDRQDEIEQVIAIAVRRAIDDYDPDFGVRFVSYATWKVRAEVQKEYDILLNLPVRMGYGLIKREFRNGTIQHHTKYDYAGSSNANDGSPLDPIMSLESPEPSAHDNLESQSLRAVMQDFVTKHIRSEREMIVFNSRIYSLDPTLPTEATLADIAEIYKVSRERIRQIEVILVKRLRKYLIVLGLKSEDLL